MGRYVFTTYRACNCLTTTFPDSKVHGANMGPTWVLSAPYGPHVGPMNLAIRVSILPCGQWVHDEIITLLLRQNDVTTSFRRNNDVIITTCVRWVVNIRLLQVPSHVVKFLELFLPLSPPGWRGIVVTVRAGGRAVGRAAAKLAEPISL